MKMECSRFPSLQPFEREYVVADQAPLQVKGTPHCQLEENSCENAAPALNFSCCRGNAIKSVSKWVWHAVSMNRSAAGARWNIIGDY